MKTKTLNLRDLPEDFFLERLYTHGTFKWLKIELEGNQETDSYDDLNYDVYMDDPSNYDSPESYLDHAESSSFLQELLDRAGYDREDFHHIHSYNDGSVNTEVTFTVRLSADGVQMAKNLMSAFGNLIDDTYRSGMHIAVMPNDPYGEDEPELTAEGVKNLDKQLSPILPWIQLLTQSDRNHRGSEFCSNRVGYEKRGYPAVYIQNNKRIEFRFFHPCYYQTDLLDHYLEVISRMLEYYDDPTKKVRLHGGTGTYRHLLGSSEFDRYVAQQGDKATKSLAFSDIFYQFTGKKAQPWLIATGFTPLSLPQHWRSEEYRVHLRSYREKEAFAKKRFNKRTAKWLAGDKTVVYDDVNNKIVRSL